MTGGSVEIMADYRAQARASLAERDAEHRAWFAQRIRHTDMAAELAKPKPIEDYVVHRFVKAGALTVLAGRAGSGKSWAAMEAAIAVKAGRYFGGAPGGMRTGPTRPAVYVDGEMGAGQMAERFRNCGLEPDAFEHLDVSGLDLGQSAGLEALEAELRKLGVRGGLVALDSLRRLTPGKQENNSDDMAPLVGALATMARDLHCGVLLLHHSGKGEATFARGSSAIVDQADAVFGLVASGDTLELTCNQDRGGKYRFGAPPPDRYFRLAIGDTPGVVMVSSAGSLGTRPLSARERFAADIRAVLEEEPHTRVSIAEMLDVSADNRNFKDALADLKNSRVAFRDERTNLWQLFAAPASMGSAEGGLGDSAPLLSPPSPNCPSEGDASTGLTA